VSKLVAGRPKDFAFAEALLRERLIDPAVLRDRIETVAADPLVVRRLRARVAGHLVADG
jgi:hypothetical protein